MYVIKKGSDSYIEASKVLQNFFAEQADYPQIVLVPFKDDSYIEYFTFDSLKTIFVETSEYPVSIDLWAEEVSLLLTQKTMRKFALKKFPESKNIISKELFLITRPMLDAGTKQAVSIAVSALKADLIEAGKPVISCGGKNNIDTVLIVIPGFSSDFSDTKILQKICAPYPV